MPDSQRTFSEILMHGMFGAFLGAIILISIQLYFEPISYRYAIGGAIFGFALGAFFGERAIEFLKNVFTLD